MKKSLTLILFLFLLGCNSKPEATNSRELVESETIKNDSTKEKIPLELSELSLKQAKEPEVKRFSTRLNDNIKESLGELSDSGAFDPVHGHNISSLDSIHKEYYLKHSKFKLLSYAIGDIFKNNQKDHIFIILDKKSTLISFVVYNDLTMEYSTLYQDIQVEQGINPDSCYYGSNGTLDYQLAQELAWHKNGFLKNQISLKENSLCSVGTLESNKDIVEDHGCYSSDHPRESLTSSICFATSLVYNNWECLKYDAERNVFIIYYGQAFAD